MTIEVEEADARIPLQLAVVDEDPAMRSVERELHAEFPSVSIEQVTILVECLWSHFDGARVRDFVPLLVQKQAKEELLDHVGPLAGPEVWPEAAPAPAPPRTLSLLPDGSTARTAE